MKQSTKNRFSVLIAAVIILTIPLSSFAAEAKISGMPKIPGVTSTKKYKNEIAAAYTYNEYKAHGFPAEFDVQTVKAGVRIDATGLRGWRIDRLESMNGTLVVMDDSEADWDSLIETKVTNGSKAAGSYQKGSYLQINEPGFYLVTARYNNPNPVSHTSWAPAKNSAILFVTGYTGNTAITETITFEETGSVTLAVGQTITREATANPSGKITYKSSDSTVATVDDNGKVTAKTSGSVKITASSGSASASYQVTVTSSTQEQSQTQSQPQFQPQIPTVPQLVKVATPCPYGTDGKKLCTTCRGTGRLEVLADSIWGDRCRTCNGVGRMICSYCGAQGYTYSYR